MIGKNRQRPGAPTTNSNASQPVPQGAGFGVFAGAYGVPERPIVPQCNADQLAPPSRSPTHCTSGSVFAMRRKSLVRATMPGKIASGVVV